MSDSDNTDTSPKQSDSSEHHIQSPAQQGSVHYQGQDFSRVPLEERYEQRAAEHETVGAQKPEESEPEIEWLHGDPDETDDTVDENVTDNSSIAFKRRLKALNPQPLSPKEKIRRNLTVLAAIFAGVCVAGIKFAAAAVTRSSAMASEGIHSLVDAANDSLMLVGQRGSKRKPDIEHPFGYGRTIYFYTFIVSVVIFVFGGGYTIYQGVQALMHGGNEIGDPLVAYIVLALGAVIESISLVIAFRDVNRRRGDLAIWEYIRSSKSPVSFTVLLEDFAAVMGMIFAFVGIALSVALKNPAYDAIASILIGALMAAVAVVLVRESTSLLIGEGLSSEEIMAVVFIVEEDPAVIKCGRVLSMYMGPNDLVLNLDVTFDDELDEGDILQAIDRLEAELIDDFPQCSAIFIEAESLNQVYRQRYDRHLALKDAEED